MDMLLTTLSLSFLAQPISLQQDPQPTVSPEKPTAAAKETATPLLFRVLSGTLAGKERGLGGSSEGWSKFEKILGGSFLHMSYHQFKEDGSLGYSMVQFFQPLADGKVAAWHFDEMGGMSTWSGEISKRGLNLVTKNPTGEVVGIQTFEWENGGYQFRLRGMGPGGREAGLIDFLQGNYQPTTKWRKAPVNKKLLEQTKQLPYAWYLGTFSGKEVSTYGNSEGVMTTAIGPGPWFNTFYQTLIQGMPVFSGMGMVMADKDGAFKLHWFEQGGGYALIEGQSDSKGNVEAILKNQKGQIVESHQDGRISDDRYTFTINQLNEKSQKLELFMTGEYVRQPK